MRRFPCIIVIVAASFHGVARAEPAPVSRDEHVDACLGVLEQAQAEHERGALVGARKLYLECVLPSCPAQVREECTRRHDEVERAIPTVVFAVRDAHARELGASILIDGAPFPAKPGRADPVDPGPHVVRVTIGERSTETTVTFRLGEKNRFVVIPWSGTPAVIAPEQNLGPPVFVARERSIGPYVVGAIGLVALATAIGALVIADHEATERDRSREAASRLSEEDPARQTVDQDAASQRKAARTGQTVAFVAGFGSLFLLGGAFVWYMLDLPINRGKAGALAPAIGPTFGGISFSRSF